MPKQTAKYRAACVLGRELGLRRNLEAEVLYQALQEAGHVWDSRTQTWNESPAANPPSRLIRLRLWADQEVIEELADDVVRLLETIGLQCDERSQAYVCRPPRQLESRVYLTFSRQGAKPGSGG